jgi:hypothetical protein
MALELVDNCGVCGRAISQADSAYILGEMVVCKSCHDAARDARSRNARSSAAQASEERVVPPPVVRGSACPAKPRNRTLVLVLLGAGGVAFLLFLAAVAIIYIMVLAVPKQEWPFHYGNSMTLGDGTNVLYVYFDRDATILVQDVYVDGHAVNWQTGEMNRGLLNAMRGVAATRPLNEVKRGEYISVQSRDRFSRVTIRTDKGDFNGVVPSTVWRY